jgi:hypothetical protein
VVPQAATPPVAARVMDLQDPRIKMSKSAPPGSRGVVRLLDPPDVIRGKFQRARTDSGTDVTYDPENKPGVSNLLEIRDQQGQRLPERCPQTGCADRAQARWSNAEPREAVDRLVRPRRWLMRQCCAPSGLRHRPATVNPRPAADTGEDELTRC